MFKRVGFFNNSCTYNTLKKHPVIVVSFSRSLTCKKSKPLTVSCVTIPQKKTATKTALSHSNYVLRVRFFSSLENDHLTHKQKHGFLLLSYTRKLRLQKDGRGIKFYLPAHKTQNDCSHRWFACSRGQTHKPCPRRDIFCSITTHICMSFCAIVGRFWSGSRGRSNIYPASALPFNFSFRIRISPSQV